MAGNLGEDKLAVLEAFDHGDAGLTRAVEAAELGERKAAAAGGW